MKLNYKRTFFIGFAFMSICAFWQLYDNAIPKMLEETFGMGETNVGIIMALDNVLALFMLPLFGALSDKTKTRFGRRTPYIVFGTILAVIFAILIPIANDTNNFILFMVALGVVLVAMSTYRSPAVALMPDLTPKPLRSKANAVINLMGAVGGIFTLIMIFVLKPTKSGTYVPVYISVAIIMVIAIAILLITVKERKIAEEVAVYDVNEKDDKNAPKEKMPKDVKMSLIFLLASIVFWFFAYNAVGTAFSRFTANVWNDTRDLYAKYLMAGTVFAILSYFPIGIISTKLGRKKVILGGIVMMTVAYFSAAFFRSVTPLAYVVFALVGIGWAAINVNSYPMVVEMSKGSDVGKYTGMYYTCSMAAQIITPIFSGFLIENTSLEYKVLFPYAVIFSALAFVTMLFVKHGDSKPEAKKDKLEYLGDAD
ncbi:MFS transporter [Paludicola sp. MB14-C6]|uniref:MFS transporter n=1 Tax=Paludihabitans sp. MB14-C6 TaxID=3070656 RepID=UPI0027DE8312|nr:MFS transporter [Paludicola sp. MB14-C6]WMJ23515.1 MFS transporter [Paludicola sp. MB14-C6]